MYYNENSNYEPLEDEEMINGRPYCKICKSERFADRGDGTWVHATCSCQKKAQDEEAAEKEKEERLAKFRESQRLTAMGERYFDARFETAIITENNEKVYDFCKKYVEHAKEMLKRNIGLYIYGDNSSGKTYLTACMCNALVEQGFQCSFTSMPQILAEIQGSYSSDSALGQAQITQMLGRKDFVFIDDLGKEFIGQSKSRFAEKVLLDVVNARYNNNKPTIFTSNYSRDEFLKMNIDNAIIERIKVMATRGLKVEGDNFRTDTLLDDRKFLKELGMPEIKNEKGETENEEQV